MHFSNGDPTTKFSAIRIEHQGEELVFSVRALKKKDNSGSDIITGVFKHINAYCDQLRPGRQQEIFDIYKAMREALDKIYNPAQLKNKLMRLSERLLLEFKQEFLEHWVRMYSSITPPDSVANSYDEVALSRRRTEGEKFRRKTYVASEYMELAVFSLQLRTMLPLWGEYIDRLIDEDSSLMYKEMMCLDLVERTEVPDCPAMERLMVYANAVVDTTGKHIMGPILGGIGTDNFSYWATSQTLVRRITTVDLEPKEGVCTLVTTLYNDLSRWSNSSKPPRNPDQVESIGKPSQSEDGVGPKGYTEVYQQVEDIAIGDRIVTELFAREVENSFRKMIPEVSESELENYSVLENRRPDIELLEQYTKNIFALSSIDYEPSDIQMRIVKTIMSPVVAIDSYTRINYMTKMRIIAAAQTVLDQIGLQRLACLITAQPCESNTVNVATRRVNGRSDYALKLEKHNPYYRNKGGKKGGVINFATTAVNEMTKALSRHNWSTEHQSFYSDRVAIDTNGIFMIDTGIRHELTTMFLYYNEVNEFNLDKYNGEI